MVAATWSFAVPVAKHSAGFAEQRQASTIHGHRCGVAQLCYSTEHGDSSAMVAPVIVQVRTRLSYVEQDMQIDGHTCGEWKDAQDQRINDSKAKLERYLHYHSHYKVCQYVLN
jgi:hypothetical protein